MDNRRLGLIFGFTIAILLVAGAIYSVYIDKIWATVLFLGAGAISLVPSLIRGWNGDRPPTEPRDETESDE
jgi:hypothetical protein